MGAVGPEHNKRAKKIKDLARRVMAKRLRMSASSMHARENLVQDRGIEILHKALS